ncbi:hypothetical protein [uncultured Parvibaculum sp.]|uniref:hypothetical protein n=1 Tax=uncultured Parvibaculum sp. TaxID=291828 RepID=UPI0030D88FAF
MTDRNHPGRRPNPATRLMNTELMRRAPDAELMAKMLADIEASTAQREKAKASDRRALRNQGRFDIVEGKNGPALDLKITPARPKKAAYGPHRNKDRWQDMAGRLPFWLKHSTYGLTPAMGAVLYTLAKELKDRREVRIAFDAIAAYAGTSQKTVERAILHLESLGLIRIQRAWTEKRNRRAINTYSVLSKKLRAWIDRFFGSLTDIFVGDPNPSEEGVTARQGSRSSPTGTGTNDTPENGRAPTKENRPAPISEPVMAMATAAARVLSPETDREPQVLDVAERYLAERARFAGWRDRLQGDPANLLAELPVAPISQKWRQLGLIAHPSEGQAESAYRSLSPVET